MGSEVILQVSVCDELLPADGALVRLLSKVYSQVSFQVASLCEALIAFREGTDVGLLSSLCDIAYMGPHMYFESA